MTVEALGTNEVPSSERERLDFKYTVTKEGVFLLEDALPKGQQQEMDIQMDGKNFKLRVVSGEKKVATATLYATDGTVRQVGQVELDPPQGDFRPKDIQHGKLGIFFFEDSDGLRAVRVKDTKGDSVLKIRGTAAQVSDIQVDGLNESGVSSILGEADHVLVTTDQSMAIGTKRGYKNGADKPKNEDGGALLEGPPKKLLVLDGMSSGGKGALAVEQALQVMTHHAGKKVNPSKVMQLGTQKLASVRRKYKFNPEQDGATACLISDEGNTIDYAVVADAKVRIFDITLDKLVHSSDEQNVVGDVVVALRGKDKGRTLKALQSAMEEGVNFQEETHDRLRAVLEVQDSGDEVPEALQKLIGDKVRKEVTGNPITSSLNPMGDMDQSPLTHGFAKIPGHTYLVLGHSDGLILTEDEIETILKRSNGKPQLAVRFLKQANEDATAPERLKGDQSGYIDDCTIGAMMA